MMTNQTKLGVRRAGMCVVLALVLCAGAASALEVGDDQPAKAGEVSAAEKLKADREEWLALFTKIDARIGTLKGDEAYEESMPLMRVAERIGRESVEMGISLLYVGIAEKLRGDYREALRLLTRSVQIMEKYPKSNVVNRAVSMFHLADTHLVLGENAQAKRVAERTVALVRGLEGQSKLLGNALLTLGNADFRLNELESAERSYREALVIYTSTEEFGSPRMLSTMLNLAKLYRQKGETLLAEGMLVQVMRVSPRDSEEFGQTELDAMSILGAMLSSQGRYELAEKYLEEACDIARKNLGVDHASTLSYTASLAEMYSESDRLNQADSLFGWVIKRRDELKMPIGIAESIDLNNYGIHLLKMNRVVESERVMRRVVVVQQELLPADHADRKTTRENLALILEKLNRADEAKAVREGKPVEMPAADPAIQPPQGQKPEAPGATPAEKPAKPGS